MKPKTTGTPQSQRSLFGDVQTPDSFKKAVQVLHSKPRTSLSLLERKLANSLLKNAVARDPNAEGWWEVSILDTEDSMGYNSNNREYLRESARHLMQVVFEWDVLAPKDRQVAWKASVLFPEVEITPSTFRYQISPQLRPLLTNPQVYALIDMNVVRRFRRASSVGIWEFGVRFERTGYTAEVDWEFFRDMVLGESAEAKSYSEYRFFKAKVLKPAIAEINDQSDHTFELLETRVGRKISKIQFKVKRKVEVVDVDPNEEDHAELMAELVKMGILPSEARRTIKTHSVEGIRGALAYTRERMANRKLPKLESPGAYLRSALKNQYQSDQAAEARPQSEPKAPKFDLATAFAERRREEAEGYFRELEMPEQTVLIERYNEAQTIPGLRVSARESRAARTAFMGWLANDLWGEPTAEDLVQFAATLLGEASPKPT